PHQSGYNKRVRAAGPLIAAAITALARDTPSWHEVLRLLDSTPVPCGMSRETVKRSDLSGHAGYGYCASHSRYFWGFRLYPVRAYPHTWTWPPALLNAADQRAGHPTGAQVRHRAVINAATKRSLAGCTVRQIAL
ncbi:hypothetical protein ABIB14_003737, partial [Arthrobacter sp. UYEF3]